MIGFLLGLPPSQAAAHNAREYQSPTGVYHCALLGSRRATSGVIRQWAAGEVLGPLDPQDIRRVGEAIGSEWLRANWRSVGAALFAVRNGHRVLGRRITQIIQKAAIGEHEISAKDREFLAQLGITMGRLQDAVTVLTVEQIAADTGMVPVDRIGRVMPA